MMKIFYLVLFITLLTILDTAAQKVDGIYSGKITQDNRKTNFNIYNLSKNLINTKSNNPGFYEIYMRTIENKVGISGEDYKYRLFDRIIFKLVLYSDKRKKNIIDEILYTAIAEHKGDHINFYRFSKINDDLTYEIAGEKQNNKSFLSFYSSANEYSIENFPILSKTTGKFISRNNLLKLEIWKDFYDYSNRIIYKMFIMDRVVEKDGKKLFYFGQKDFIVNRKNSNSLEGYEIDFYCELPELYNENKQRYTLKILANIPVQHNLNLKDITVVVSDFRSLGFKNYEFYDAKNKRNPKPRILLFRDFVRLYNIQEAILYYIEDFSTTELYNIKDVIGKIDISVNKNNELEIKTIGITETWD